MIQFLTRRAFLRRAPVAAAVVATPAIASTVEKTPAETPAARVTRLGWELADALNDYADGMMHAEVYPSDKRGEFSVGFKIDYEETQEQKIQRMIRVLQHEMKQMPTREGVHEFKFEDGQYLRLDPGQEGGFREASDLLVGFVPALPKGGDA